MLLAIRRKWSLSVARVGRVSSMVSAVLGNAREQAGGPALPGVSLFRRVFRFILSIARVGLGLEGNWWLREEPLPETRPCGLPGFNRQFGGTTRWHALPPWACGMESLRLWTRNQSRNEAD